MRSGTKKSAPKINMDDAKIDDHAAEKQTTNNKITRQYKQNENNWID